MTNTKKLIETIKQFNQDVDAVQEAAIDELKTRITEIEGLVSAPAKRKRFCEILLSYKPSAEDIERAKLTYSQITGFVDQFALVGYGRNKNFLAGWFVEKRQGNYLKESAEELANAIVCALIGKISSGMFNFEPEIMHETFGYDRSLEYLLNPLMPKQAEKQLAEYKKLEDELATLRKNLDVLSTDFRQVLPIIGEEAA